MRPLGRSVGYRPSGRRTRKEYGDGRSVHREYIM
jgi:hypothetical protein